MSIASELSRIQQAKSDLATSITNKGVTVPAATTLDGYAALVDQIQTGGGSELPYDAEVEYLESDGTAYIDMGFAANQTTCVDTMFMRTGTMSNFFLFGGRPTSTANDREYGCMPYNNSRINFRFGSNPVNVSYSISSSTKYRLYTNRNAFYLQNSSGTQVATGTATNNTFNTTVNLILFGTLNGTSAIAYSGVRIYYFKITNINNGVLMMDFIPVRKNGVGYMYDKVSGQLFGNANNTGAFTYGNDVT